MSNARRREMQAGVVCGGRRIQGGVGTLAAMIRPTRFRFTFLCSVALFAASLCIRVKLQMDHSARFLLVGGNVQFHCITAPGSGNSDPTWDELGWLNKDEGECELVRIGVSTSIPKFYAHWPGLHETVGSASGGWWALIIPLWLPSLIILIAWTRSVRGRAAIQTKSALADRHHSRFVRRSLCVLCALGVAACLGSTCGTIEATFNETDRIAFGQGNLSWLRFDEPRMWYSHDLSVYAEFSSFEFTFDLPHSGSTMQSTIGHWNEWVLPLWPVPAICLVGLYATRIPRSDRICRRCCYDLTGNVSGRCPECGNDIPTPAQAIDASRVGPHSSSVN